MGLKQYVAANKLTSKRRGVGLYADLADLPFCGPSSRLPRRAEYGASEELGTFEHLFDGCAAIFGTAESHRPSAMSRSGRSDGRYRDDLKWFEPGWFELRTIFRALDTCCAANLTVFFEEANIPKLVVALDDDAPEVSGTRSAKASQAGRSCCCEAVAQR